jgi:hypothetical protein
MPGRGMWAAPSSRRTRWKDRNNPIRGRRWERAKGTNRSPMLLLLGVLALAGISSDLTLILIAFLAIGMAILLGSLALAGRMLSLVRRA